MHMCSLYLVPQASEQMKEYKCQAAPVQLCAPTCLRFRCMYKHIDQVAVQVIRDHLKACEEADAERAILPQHFDADGEIDNAHIRCAGCSNIESSDDNDILLCDGELCTKAYHVGCLPVKGTFDAEELPDDVGWLCPACDCRHDILWNLAENFDLDYEELIPLQCGAAAVAHCSIIA